MKIEHVAIWVKELEQMRTFYERYFSVTSNKKYVNPEKGFSSYFLSFHTGARLEIMHRDDMEARGYAGLGWAHIAISLGTKEKVDALTEKLRDDGFHIFGEPRITGDGYYESVVEDPEGNLIELTV